MAATSPQYPPTFCTMYTFDRLSRVIRPWSAALTAAVGVRTASESSTVTSTVRAAFGMSRWMRRR